MGITEARGREGAWSVELQEEVVLAENALQRTAKDDMVHLDRNLIGAHGVEPRCDRRVFARLTVDLQK